MADHSDPTDAQRPDPAPRQPVAEPEPGRPRPVVVGIGASAGGLRALKQFLATVPADTGLGFVVVVHLSPEHESHLADLLQPHCALPVSTVTGETPVEPDRVYVIPPGSYLTAVDSHLRLAPLAESRRDRAPIDHFFRTLATTHDGASVGVILSGTGSDGAHGIRHIRAVGGMTLAQDPDEAEFDGMARSAIDTGLVDRVLPISAMVGQILEFATTRPGVPITEERGGAGEADPLQTILTLVRLRTGHDFLRYKHSTVRRRVARRMQLLSLERIDAYVELLREDGREAGLLLDDLLINVTSFFRDPDVFRTLETELIPQLFEAKNRGDAVRVWSVGCATGEEAYSLGMLLMEEAARRPNPPQLQVFATDLHERSLQKGREAFFPEGIEEQLSRERLDRFFRREGAGYRVVKQLRDIVVFAKHNLLRDPPFSRLDLIVCRNLLIYLQRDVQDEVIDVFHYALRSGGYLLLGTAETLDRSDLFRVQSKEAHLYRRRDGPRGATRLPPIPSIAAPRPRPADPGEALPRPHPAQGYGAVHQRMVERYAPPSLLVTADHEVVHTSENASRYLRYPAGEATRNLFRVVREELGPELRTALHMVRERASVWRSRPIALPIEGEPCQVVLRVSPAEESDLEGFALVIFDEVGGADAEPRTAPAEDGDRVHDLEAELEVTRSRMQALVEEFETGQEEMRASNEELQSANEELRSTMEELETSREELQSVNEELHTLNQENRHKVEELSQLSSDLQNLLQATDIATVFLDRSLRILRFTRRVSELFNVRHTDRGRPLADLTHRLGYGGLIEDAQRVLQTLVPLEREVRVQGGNTHYVLRVAPYRTMDERIEGIVITLVDVTRVKSAEAAVRESEMRYRALVTASSDAVYRMGPDWTELRELDGRGFVVDTEQPDSQWLDEYIFAEDQPQVLAAIQEATRTKSTFEFEHRVRRADGSAGWAFSRAVPLLDEQGEIVEWFGTASDITERKRREANRELVADVSEELSRLASEAEIIRAVGAKLTAHLGLSCYHYVDVDEERGQVTVRHFWHAQDVPSILGTFPLDGFLPPDGLDRARAGQTDVIHDVQRDLAGDDAATAALKAGAAAQKIGAYVVVPYSQDGSWRAYFAVADRAPRRWTDLEVELIQEVAARVFPRIERVRAEAALEAERTYAESIVETLHEPLVVLTPDLRVRSANQAFYEHFEVRREGTQGRLIYELGNGQWDIPELRLLLEDVLPDSNVFNDFEVSHRFEDIGHRVMLLNARRLDHVQLILLGIRDITEKKRAGERQAFLLSLSDGVRQLLDPAEITATISESVGRYLEVGRCGYGEVPPPHDHFVVTRDWTNGVMPSLQGAWPVAIFGEKFIEQYRAGQTVVVEDSHADERGRAGLDTTGGVRAGLAVPLIKGGEWVAAFYIHDTSARRWTRGEIELVEEAAERTWAAIERARAEEALREMNQTLERRVVERTEELERTNQVLSREIEEREGAETARSEALRQLVNAEESERRRISRELHDQMAQLMTALLLGLKTLESQVEDATHASRLQELEEMADRIAREMQHMAMQLRPPALDNLGLRDALQSHLEEWSARYGIAADFHASGFGATRLPPELETTLYRVTQEGLTNVLKYAEATRISLVLERRRGTVSLILEDDGVGFDVEQTLALPEKTHRLGVRGMKERVALLGGELELESSPGLGTTVYARIPESRRDAGGAASRGGRP